MSTPTDAEMNLAMCEWMGDKPRRLWRVWWDKDKEYGSIRMPNRSEALRQIEHARANHIEFTPGDKFWHSEPEEYDDWYDSPDYLSDDSPRRLLNEAEARLKEEQRDLYVLILHFNKTDTHYSQRDFAVINESARQRVIAILQTIKPKMFN